MSQHYNQKDRDMEICRFCLKLESENNLTPLLSGFFNEMLTDLHLNINLTISDNPVICYCCFEKLQKCVFFKALCNVAGERKLNSSNINVCYLCSKTTMSNSDVPNMESNKYIATQKLRKYIPLLNLQKENILCHICEDYLKTMDEFSTLCLSNEAAINTFNKFNKYEGQLSLQKVIEFSKEYTWTYDKEPKTLDIKEEIDIELDEIKPNLLSVEIKTEDGPYINDSDSQNQLPSFTNQCERDEQRIQSMLLPRKDSNNYWRTSEHVDQELRFYCYNCTFQTKFKASLVRHMLVHRNYSEVETFQCNECNFVTKYKASLIVHLLVHKAPSEISMFKCDVCPYQTKLKKNLIYHKVTHKNISDLDLYKCSNCPFVTKFKSNLAKHGIIHKNISEVTLYNCPQCPYETRFKRNLKKHGIVHKTPSETKMYTCMDCNFSTKFKYSLIKHALVHKDISEIKMYECTLCPFKTKFRYGLIRHNLIHKSLSEVPNVYECYHCPYKSKLKSNLVQHCIRHRIQNNDKVHKCEMCSFVSNHKINILRHAVVHKNNNEIIYKCESCPYETTVECNFMRHSKIHDRQNYEI